MARNSTNGQADGPVDRLKSEATDLIGAFGDHAVSSLRDKVEGATERLTEYAKGSATPALKAAVAGAKSHAEGKGPVRSAVSAGAAAVKEKVGNMIGNGAGSRDKMKVTNIVESIDVGVPVKLAYDEWTQFTAFPSFMKKVENVDQDEDQKLRWRAQVLWSHRTWESTIVEQVPDDKIVWRSEGDKGYVDGAVTFHELAPNLTRILVTLEYHPKGFFEHVGNLWRAQGRRVRLELKHFQRHVMTEVLLHPDEVEGWRGLISDGKVQDKGKRQGTGGRGQKKDEGGDKGSTRTRRAPTAGRAAPGGQRRGDGRQRSGSAGSTGPSARSSSPGSKASGSRPAGGSKGGTKSKRTPGRGRKAASQ
jgi:uncharacterized membrane protein